MVNLNRTIHIQSVIHDASISIENELTLIYSKLLNKLKQIPYISVKIQ